MKELLLSDVCNLFATTPDSRRLLTFFSVFSCLPTFSSLLFARSKVTLLSLSGLLFEVALDFLILKDFCPLASVLKEGDSFGAAIVDFGVFPSTSLVELFLE